MISIDKAREQAFKLATSTYRMGNSDFQEYSSIYLASTANVKGTMNLYKGTQKVLSVGETGAHGYEAALNGATKIDLFDINELQRLFFEYMKTAIMVLSYQDFIKYFTLNTQSQHFQKRDIKNLLANELYDKLYPYLPNDVAFVFGPLFDYFDSPDLILSGLFRFEHPIYLEYLKRNISFYNEEEYYKLQKILRSEQCQINYYQTSLTSITDVFSEKYDLIVLDNILQYYSQLKDMGSPYEVNKFIDKKLSLLLEEEGKIQACYGFATETVALKEILSKSSASNNRGYDMISQAIIKEAIKKGICPQLVKKWDNYSYDFISAVEEEEGFFSDNVVLTYRKSKRK